MSTTLTQTRSDLLTAVKAVRDAGGTTTHMLHTIARLTTGPAAPPEQIEQQAASVFDTAGFYYDDLSSSYERDTGKTPYPHDTATFDDLTGDDQMTVIQHIVNEFGDLDETVELPPPPVALAENLLHCLRKAAALKVEYSPRYGRVYDTLRESIVMLLAEQSVSYSLAVESIDHALESRKGIAEAVAYMDGQL